MPKTFTKQKFLQYVGYFCIAIFVLLYLMFISIRKHWMNGIRLGGVSDRFVEVLLGGISSYIFALLMTLAIGGLSLMFMKKENNRYRSDFPILPKVKSVKEAKKYLFQTIVFGLVCPFWAFFTSVHSEFVYRDRISNVDTIYSSSRRLLIPANTEPEFWLVSVSSFAILYFASGVYVFFKSKTTA